MTIEDVIRAAVREEVRAAFAELAPSSKWEGCLKLKAAAALVGGLSVSTIEKWGREGLKIQRKGRVRVVDVAELRAFVAKLETSKVSAPADRAREILSNVTALRRIR